MQVKNYRAKRKSIKTVQFMCFGILLLASNTFVYFYAKGKGAIDASESSSTLNLGHSLDSSSDSKSQYGWKTDQLPIMKSITDGFHPIYVYSKVHDKVRRKEFSQVKQDKIILALSIANDAKSTNPTKEKFFVDLAANDALELSNTYRLEKNHWKGLCIEPNPIYWYNLAAYRSCTIVGGFIGGTSSEDGKEVDVILSNGVFGGIASDQFDNKPENGKMEKRNLVSIETIFRQTNVPTKIDYFSLDVEGAESIVMADFPWQAYSFKFVTIERPKDDLIQIMVRNGYKKALNITDWGETLWVNTKEVLLSQQEIEDIVKDYPNPHSVVKK
eukprot:scaffold5366_cov154-Chaetoceros_neogracile.AAC.4